MIQPSNSMDEEAELLNWAENTKIVVNNETLSFLIA